MTERQLKEQSKGNKGTKQIKGLFKVAVPPAGARSSCAGARRSRSQKAEKERKLGGKEKLILK